MTILDSQLTPKEYAFMFGILFLLLLKQYSRGKHYHMYDKKTVRFTSIRIAQTHCSGMWLVVLTNSTVKSAQGNGQTTQIHSQKMKQQPMSLFPTPTKLQDFMLGQPIWTTNLFFFFSSSLFIKISRDKNAINPLFSSFQCLAQLDILLTF